MKTKSKHEIYIKKAHRTFTYGQGFISDLLVSYTKNYFINF